MFDRERKKSFLIVAGIFTFLFLMIFLMTTGTNGFIIDETVSFWAQEQSSPLLMTFMAYASVLGSTEMILIVTFIIGLVFLIRRSWRYFFFFFTVSVGGVILNFLLKILIQRARPGEEVSYIETFNLTLNIQSYSFPSGHVMRATIFFSFLIYLTYQLAKRTVVKFGLFIIFIALLIGTALSRVILDAHFVTDVVGGLLISIGWFFLCLYFFHKPRQSGLTFSR